MHEIPRRRWWLVPLLVVAGLALMGFAAVKLYRRLEPERLARKAKGMIDARDYQNASITLSRALQINPNNVSATRAAVELMEALRLPKAIAWHQRLAELVPGAAPEALSWANIALREGKADLAKVALESVSPSGRGIAEWHSAAGLADIRSGRWKAARGHFIEAARLDPASDMHRYNLALTQIQSADTKERMAGLAALSQPSLQKQVELFSQRALITQLSRDGKSDEALTRSEALVGKPYAELADGITHLDLIRDPKNPAWPPALAAAQALAIQRPGDAATLLRWFRRRGDPAAALEWAKQFPGTHASDPAVQAAMADCFLAIGSWQELRKIAVDSDWGTSNARRLALLARAQMELGESDASSGSWSAALRLARKDRGSLAQLAATASDWGWKKQMREVLWQAAEAPGSDWALRILHHSYMTDRDTTGLWLVARRQIALNPKDIRARNNAAQCALLLHNDVRQAMEQARDLVKETPADPILISTHAFALLVNGQPEAALAEIKKVPAEKLRQPSLALYAGLILNAAGRQDEALEYLKLTENEVLLPEEKLLRDRALGK